MSRHVNIAKLLVPIVFCCLIGCDQGKKIIKPEKKIFQTGRFVLDKSCDSTGKITGDLKIVNSKVEIDYYPNGNIHKWKQFFGDSFPKCIVYYDTDGVFDTFIGNPFLKYGEKYLVDTEKWLGTATINPPNIDFFLLLIDSNEKQSQTKPSVLHTLPTIRDTCAWFFFDGKYNSLPGHFCKMRFYFIDSAHGLFRRAGMEIEIADSRRYVFYPIPYLSFPFKEYQQWFK